MQIGANPLARSHHSATIVSFDDAKRSSRVQRARARRDRVDALSAAERPLVYFDPGSDARFNLPSDRGRRSATTSARPSQRSSSRTPRHARPAEASGSIASTSFSRDASASRRGMASARTASHGAAASAGRKAPSWYDGLDERAVRDEAARRAQVRQEAREIEEQEEQGKASPLQKLRRAAAKRKADKVFGAEGAAGAVGEGGPRAALYKGEMGSSQRRASRMQDGAASDNAGARPRPRKGFSFGPGMRIVAAVLGCLALICVFLYQPAQQCYQSMRERDALAVERDALQQREDALQSNVDALSTEAGIEDLAHEQYGLVKKGEVAVSVSGVTDSSEDDSTIPPNVSSDSIDPPDTWYSGILDPLFGVE